MKTSLLRTIVGFLRSPGGKAAVTAGCVEVTGPAAALIGNWGTEGLAAILDGFLPDEITDEAIVEHLKTKGITVTPFRADGLFGG